MPTPDDPPISPPISPTISVGRDDAAHGEAPADPAPKHDDAGSGRGHPLPASEKARHGSIPESIERARGHGAN